MDLVLYFFVPCVDCYSYIWWFKHKHGLALEISKVELPSLLHGLPDQIEMGLL